jgi:TRAP-type C4-dicarboxylate transport system substrate-binding protein
MGVSGTAATRTAAQESKGATVQHTKRITRISGLAIGTAILAATAGCATTESPTDGGITPTTLELATYLGPQTPYGQAIEWFVAEVAEQSDGAVEIEVFWEGALLTGPDVLTGVSQGRAALGFSTPNYSPAELPLTQIMSIPFLAEDVVATQDAFTELYATNADYQNEWSSLGVRPLAFQAVTPMIIAGTDVPEDYEWLAGKQVRATSLMGNAVQAAGGNAVALALPEVYESVQRGLLQGVASLNFGTIPSISLQEVAPHVAYPGTGIYSITTLFANEATWSGLDENVRAVLESAAGGFNDVYLERLGAVEEETCDVILDAGGSVTVWDESDAEAWADELGDSITDIWKTSAAASGADLDAFYDEYVELANADIESSYVDGTIACADR